MTVSICYEWSHNKSKLIALWINILFPVLIQKYLNSYSNADVRNHVDILWLEEEDIVSLLQSYELWKIKQKLMTLY